MRQKISGGDTPFFGAQMCNRIRSHPIPFHAIQIARKTVLLVNFVVFPANWKSLEIFVRDHHLFIPSDMDHMTKDYRQDLILVRFKWCSWFLYILFYTLLQNPFVFGFLNKFFCKIQFNKIFYFFLKQLFICICLFLWIVGKILIDLLSIQRRF